LFIEAFIRLYIYTYLRGEEPMIRHEKTITVANDATLKLPALSDDKLAHIKSKSVDKYIREIIHATHTLGWPDAADIFSTTGIVIQALDERTARVILVVDDHIVRTNLAVYAAIYAHWDYTLLIDQATFLRAPFREIPEAQPTTTPPPTPDTFGMEVA
jgi:hypothetical protein